VRHSARLGDGSVVSSTIEHKRIARWGLRGNVWDYNVGGYGHTTTDKVAYKHPALMSEAMAEDHILSWSIPGDLVFDPMCGAATTCKMALLNHRQYLGMEINRPYWECAVKRMQQARHEYLRRFLEWRDFADGPGQAA